LKLQQVRLIVDGKVKFAFHKLPDKSGLFWYANIHIRMQFGNALCR
jgi:hypothetical protein